MEILTALPQIFKKLVDEKMIDPNLMIRGVIHVGAHEGQEYNLYRYFGIPNLLFYEPLKENFEKLKANVGPEVDIRNKALGNKNGIVEMHLEDRGLSSSILIPEFHLEQYPQIVFNRVETVDIARLDDEVFDNSKFNFMNIDVQGYELEVLKGAAETLKNIDLLITEINRVEMYKDCALVEDLDAFLTPYGFKRVVTYWQLDGETWGDALYIK